MLPESGADLKVRFTHPSADAREEPHGPGDPVNSHSSLSCTHGISCSAI